MTVSAEIAVDFALRKKLGEAFELCDMS